MNGQERNKQSLETILSGNKFIKSEYDEEILISVGEFGQGGDITVRKEDGKWHGSDGKTFMGYLTPDEIVEWYDKDYGSAWLCNSRRPIKSSYNIVGVNVDSDGNLYYKFWNEDKKTFDRDSVNCTEYEDKDTAQYELQYRIPSKYDTIFDYFEIHDFNKPYKLHSSRKHKISSSQKGFENVAEGTQYDDYHIDTTGMGILDVEHIISEIEGRGNQAVLTVQTSDGATQHTQFTLDDWKKYKNAVNGVDEFSRNSGSKGAAITDVWVTEVKGGSYVHNSRRPIKSGYNDLFNQIKKYIEDETVGKGRVETEGNIIHYRTLIVTVDDYGYSMHDTWSDFYDKGDNIEDFKKDYWEWVNPF